MGLLSELLKYAYFYAVPRLNFAEVYGPFAISVSLIFWAFLSGMLLLTLAHWSGTENIAELSFVHCRAVMNLLTARTVLL